VENSIDDNVILEDADEIASFTILDLIDNQLEIIANVIELPIDVYDKMHEDIVKTVILSFRVINQAQIKLLKNL